MAEKDSSNLQPTVADGRKEYWLQQYAAAFTDGDRRGAAIALQFVRQYNTVVARAEPKEKQQG